MANNTSNKYSWEEYSENEIILFQKLGLFHLVFIYYNPMLLWETAVHKAFSENMTGNAVEALRRGYHAIFNGVEFRGSFEFEKLIVVK